MSILETPVDVSASTSKRPVVINVVTGKGGGGHYATYQALRAVLTERQHQPQRRPYVFSYQFQVTDMDDIMAQMSQSKESLNAYQWLGSSVSELYNTMLKRGWTWLWPLQMNLNKLLVKLNTFLRWIILSAIGNSNSLIWWYLLSRCAIRYCGRR
ncbi:MAG: hypothetical protein HC800_00055 [Phormidesmis sp. RL_2_1]|nr:hypothetical protein [Phormidesmis sp. RL_2_1]